MATEVVMPRLSDTMDSGTIAKWLKQEGDPVKRGDIIAEIETDKANMEMEAYASGILARIDVREGQSAGVGDPIAVIAKDEAEAKSLAGGGANAPAKNPVGPREGAPPGEVPGAREEASPTKGVEQVPPAQGEPAAPQGGGPVRARGQGTADAGTAPEESGPNGRVKASPLARRIAQEHSISLEQVTGTGPGGRITREDVEEFLQRPRAAAPTQQAPAQPQPSPSVPAERSVSSQPSVTVETGGVRAAQPVEMTRMQQTIARRMTEARFSAPDFVLTAELDMTEARGLLQTITATEGAPKVGPNDLLIKAVAGALREHPEVNAGWENDSIVRYGRINVGNAVAVEGGLVVPVIQGADTKTLGEIARESKGLIEKARAGKLAPGEYEGGTFTVSNLGMYGIDQFTPVINVPEACILGVGAIIQKPVVQDGEVVVRDRMRVTLSCDHRVINGAQGAEFLRTLRRLLENPVLTVL